MSFHEKAEALYAETFDELHREYDQLIEVIDSEHVTVNTANITAALFTSHRDLFDDFIGSACDRRRGYSRHCLRTPFSRTQAAKQEKSHHQSHRQPQCHHYAFLAGDPAFRPSFNRSADRAYHRA